MVLLAVAGILLARRWVGVEVLKLNNEVAGFIYAVIGVVYAVLLGFTTIIVWEQYDKAQAVVDQEANELADLYRNAQTFPDNVRRVGNSSPQLCPARRGEKLAGDGRTQVQSRDLGRV
jgi:predicted membrane chloride channel (bestrophin family)